MTGDELSTFCTEVNGGEEIGSTFLYQLIGIAKALVEQRRPWMLLRSTDSSVITLAGSRKIGNENPTGRTDGVSRVRCYRPKRRAYTRNLYEDAPWASPSALLTGC
jgi:hypothetical protein